MRMRLLWVPVGVAAMLASGISAGSSTAQVTTAQSTIGTAASTCSSVAGAVRAAAVAPAPASHNVYVWVTLGGRAYVRDATVEVLDRRGRILQTATTMSGGAALFDRRDIIGATWVRATGGRSTVGGFRNNAVLTAPMRVHPTDVRITYVSPVSTITQKVAKDLGISYHRARGRVLDNVEIPRRTSAAQHATFPHYFHHDAFTRFVTDQGGVRQALGTIARDVKRGGQHHPFKAQAQPTSRSVASWAAQQAITALVEGATGESPAGAIGTLLGISDPSTTVTNEIFDQLEAIETELATVEEELSDVEATLANDEYNTLIGTLSPLPGNTKNDWATYKVMLANPEQLDDTATVAGNVSDWLTDLTPSFGAWDGLFDDFGADGALTSLYSKYSTSNAWFDEDITTAIAAAIDTFGSIYAQSAILISEAKSFDKGTYTAADICDFATGTVQPQITAIYDSMPTALAKGEVGDPATGLVYKITPATATAAVLSYAGNGGESQPASCDHLGTTYDFSSGKLTTSATVEGWWTKAAPAGWTVSTTSPFSLLEKTRSINNVTQNALLTLASGDSGAWAVVTADSVPYLGGYNEPKIVGDHEEGTIYTFTGWLWCGSNTVTLVGVEGKPTQWTTNFMMSNGSYVPTNGSVSATGSIPVGVLVQQQGNFASVDPAS